MDFKKVVHSGLQKVEGLVVPEPTKVLDPAPDANTLKGGNATLDVRLDRIPQFDERSRDYPIRTLLTQEATFTPQPVNKTWGCRVWNDQGQEGACVGFAWSHELAAVPVEILANSSTAFRIYKRAQQLDYWPGEDYEGTSVLGGAKAVQELKTGGKPVMPSYRWAFGVDDLILAVGHHGPAVLGINWYSGMFNTNSFGFISATGQLAGGHAILARGIGVKWKVGTTTRTLADLDRDKSFFTLRNSWGKDWGRYGDCYITVNDMDKLLKEQGECCIPVVRK